MHAFVNDLARPVGTHLLGRRMYDVLVAWETMPTGDEQPAAIRDYTAIWHATDKIVYSKTLDAPASARTRIEREFDPDAVRRLKVSADRDLSVSGPNLAAQAIRAGLVDEMHLFLNPIVIGRGNPALPDDVRMPLELLDERRFKSGVVHLHYAVDA